MKRTTTLLTLMLICTIGLAQQRTDSVHVAHYGINLAVTDFTDNVISGHTDLAVVSKVNGLTQVHLDLKAMTVDSITVNQVPATFSRAGEALFVDVPALQTGDTAHLCVHYHGVPTHDGYFGGFYFTNGYAYNVGVALSDIPHSYGRCWYPCLDEFTDKSSYDFHIRTLGNHRAVCNGLLTDSLTLPDSTRLWSWQIDEPIPAYLVSMAVGNYLCYADTFHGMEAAVPIQIYAAPNLYPNIPASFVHLKEVLHQDEAHFGPYRWPRVGYVCVGMTGGAMEHATNIALPNAAVNGSLTYEGTIMHELFHHWFGDLITCERPEEMWINEGFADYSEALAQEWLYTTPTFDAYSKHIHDEHVSTLQNLAKQDDGLYPLDSVPQDHTYGMHSYQKGGQVIHTLRSYMGDSLFFSSLRQLLDHYAYQNINSVEFFTYLSQVSGMNLMNFYEDWIHQPGFLDFDVDGILSLSCGIYQVTIRQKGYGTHHTGTEVPVDITFVSNDMEMYTYEDQLITGDSTVILLFCPFEPAFAITDLNGKLADATIEEIKTVSATGSVSFNDSYCSAKVNQISDTAMIYMAHHLVPPTTPDPLPEGYHKFSTTHYWTVNQVGGIQDGKWNFRLTRAASQPDYDLLAGGYTLDNLKLMWRPDGFTEWIPVAFERSGSPYNSTLSTDMLNGQYCFAVADEDVAVEIHSGVHPSVYPNPAKERVVVKATAGSTDKIVLIDSLGRRILSQKFGGDTQELDISSLPAGHYHILFYRKGQRVASVPVVKS